MTIPYTKPPLTFTDQVVKLQSRGMLVPDTAQAESFLSRVNYYRLTAYWLPFEQTHEPPVFRPGTTFDSVKSLYVADRELRLLFMDALGRIEIAFRTQWAYHFSHAFGPHAHLDRAQADDLKMWGSSVTKLIHSVGGSKEKFILHSQSKYSEILPPVWAVCELMSMGELSHWFAHLKDRNTRELISSAFSLDLETFASWIQHLCYVRNLCAHHSRLWNRSMTKTPKVPRGRPVPLRGEFVVEERNTLVPGRDARHRKIYNTMLIMLYLMDQIAPQSDWRSRLRTHLASGTLNLNQMGFPTGWEERPIWTGATA
jgi:abortive infection bacteriophage resistance protein